MLPQTHTLGPLIMQVFDICRMCNWHLQISKRCINKNQKSVSDPTRCVWCSTRHILFKQNRHSQGRRRRSRQPFCTACNRRHVAGLMGCVWWWCQTLAFSSRVDRPITDRLPLWSNIYLYFHHMCLILSDLKCNENATSSSRNHFWSSKEKGVMKKQQEGKQAFQLTKCVCVFFSSLWTPLTFKPYNLFFIHFKRFKVL